MCCKESERFHFAFLILKHWDFKHPAFRCTHDVILVKCDTVGSRFLWIEETVLVLSFCPCHTYLVVADRAVWVENCHLSNV
jgi:hypothetical protein